MLKRTAPTVREKELAKIATLLDELDGITFDNYHYKGYHPLVFKKRISNKSATAMVTELTNRLVARSKLNMYSLEMHDWWYQFMLNGRKKINKALGIR